MSGTLIAGGKEIPVDCEVVRDWPKLFFAGLRPRKETRHGVIHWTGGPHLAPIMFRNLGRRTGSFGQPAKLSVHLCVNPDGTVYQFCDLDMRCAHAGTVDDSDRDGHELSANAWSWGIEVVNPATIFSEPPPGAKATIAGVERQVVLERVNDRELLRTTFTAKQTASVLALVLALCGHYRLPIAVPKEDGDVLSHVMTETAFAKFRGVVGHYMLTRGKPDPGIAIMRAIAALPMRGKERPAE